MCSLVHLSITLSSVISSWCNQAHALSCTALCQPMRWLVSLSKLSTLQLRPHPYWESMVHSAFQPNLFHSRTLWNIRSPLCSKQKKNPIKFLIFLIVGSHWGGLESGNGTILFFIVVETKSNTHQINCLFTYNE